MWMLRNLSLILAAASIAAAQVGIPAKPKASDYPASIAVEKATLGAEYMVRSFTSQGQMFLVEGYLVVEVALFPDKDTKLDVNAGRFRLRINGKKNLLAPQTPGIVAGTMRIPDWQQRPRMEAGAGMGNTGVILGRPRTTERFPGDPTPGQTRLPNPPRVPEPEDRSGAEKKPELKADEQAIAAALPEGPVHSPVAGYLYFAYPGKPGGIKSLDLLYDDAALRLVGP